MTKAKQKKKSLENAQNHRTWQPLLLCYEPRLAFISGDLGRGDKPG